MIYNVSLTLVFFTRYILPMLFFFRYRLSHNSSLASWWLLIRSLRIFFNPVIPAHSQLDAASAHIQQNSTREFENPINPGENFLLGQRIYGTAPCRIYFVSFKMISPNQSVSFLIFSFVKSTQWLVRFTWNGNRRHVLGMG